MVMMMVISFQETGSTDVVFMKLDLASLKSVRCFTERFLETESRLDLLINNAGTHTHTHTHTHCTFGASVPWLQSASSPLDVSRLYTLAL